MKHLTVQGRYLLWDDSTPFFYLGDTAWELFHALSREEILRYCEVRQKQGFTAIQCVALSECDGVRTPNFYGRLPLLCTDGVQDPDKPDTAGPYSYWDHVDYAVSTAAQHGLFITLLPTWGDKFHRDQGAGPEIFTEDNAYRYGKWIAHRYKDQWNIIWMLGGDRYLLNARHRRIIDEMARGIREEDPVHLITFHPPGSRTSVDFVGDAPYIDFHASQTGHNTERCFCSDQVMREMRQSGDKPYLDAEPRYEDHPACFDAHIGYFWVAEDVRQNAYWNVLTGTCGHTYGNHCVWSMTRTPTDYFPFRWDEVMEHPGAEQMRYVKQLRLSRDYTSLAEAPELLPQNFPGMGHMVAAKGSDYAYIYTPLGVPFTVKLDPFPGATYVRALWFDPRTGSETAFAILPAEGETLIVPPTQGKGCDWVLILEAVRK